MQEIGKIPNPEILIITHLTKSLTIIYFATASSTIGWEQLLMGTLGRMGIWMGIG